MKPAVQGTFGYLDPEYYHTGQLSEKSYVYSLFILVELLTRKKPIFTNNLGEPLEIDFLQAGSYTELIDVDIREQFTEEEIEEIITHIEMCLKMRGEERPALNEVSMRLQFIRTHREKRRAVSSNNGGRASPSRVSLHTKSYCQASLDTTKPAWINN